MSIAADLPRTCARVLRDAWGAWSRHGTGRLAAALSFYTLFSLAPMVMVITAFFGWLLGDAAVQTALHGWLVDTVGADTAGTVQGLVAGADRPGAQAATAGIGVATMLLGATRTFDQFQQALNEIWEVGDAAKTGVAAAVGRKALSFGLVLAIGLFVVVSVTVGASLQGLAIWLSEQWGLPSHVAVLTHDLTNLIVLTAAFALVFGWVPARREPWGVLAMGGFWTAVFFSMGKHGIAVYLGRSSPGSAYGASGSLVVLLLWVYYSMMIVLWGAELTQAIARLRRKSVGEATPTGSVL